MLITVININKFTNTIHINYSYLSTGNPIKSNFKTVYTIK